MSGTANKEGEVSAVQQALVVTTRSDGSSDGSSDVTTPPSSLARSSSLVPSSPQASSLSPTSPSPQTPTSSSQCLAIKIQSLHYEVNLSQEIGKGSWGLVYEAYRSPKDGDQKVKQSSAVALKFFGYLAPCDWASINDEIMKMMYLSGVKGAIQIVGVFYDNGKGILNKKHRKMQKENFPVIVMECLQYQNQRGLDKRGLSLINYTLQESGQKDSFDERSKAKLFKKMIVALAGIHEKGFIHCDLSPNNLMIVDPTSKEDDDFSVKIIDFGAMQRPPVSRVTPVTPPNDAIDYEESRRGTCDGSCGDNYQGELLKFHDQEQCNPKSTYYTPEMRFKLKFSEKSDIWQLGVILHKLITGNWDECVRENSHLKFTHAASSAVFTNYFGKICDCCYHKLLFHEIGGDKCILSENCKDLLKKLLCRDPNHRISLREIQSHPWLSDGYEGNRTPFKETDETMKKYFKQYKDNLKDLLILRTLAKIWKCDLSKSKSIDLGATDTESIIRVKTSYKERVFAMLNKNNTKEINFEQFQSAIREMLTSASLFLPNEQDIRSLFDLVDDDHSGAISFDEFDKFFYIVTHLSTLAGSKSSLSSSSCSSLTSGGGRA